MFKVNKILLKVAQEKNYEQERKETNFHGEREKEKLLHFSSWNHEKKDNSKNRFANIKDTLIFPNKKTVSSWAKMSGSKHYPPLASWVPILLLNKINFYEIFAPSFKRKQLLQTLEQQVAN